MLRSCGFCLKPVVAGLSLLRAGGGGGDGHGGAGWDSGVGDASSEPAGAGPAGPRAPLRLDRDALETVRPCSFGAYVSTLFTKTPP